MLRSARIQRQYTSSLSPGGNAVRLGSSLLPEPEPLPCAKYPTTHPSSTQADALPALFRRRPFRFDPQQYLIALPDGKLQALGIAWDSRPTEDGGQHWFHFYPDEADIDAANPLHWTPAWFPRTQTWRISIAPSAQTLKASKR
jgi:hypothetical protein